MRMIFGVLCAALVTWGASSGVQAQSAADYPNKPIKIIVPFAPGGIVDTSARVIGQALSKRWGQHVVVENRPGGNGFIGVMAAVNAPADGYTLLMAHTGEFAVNPAIFPNVPYNLERDLAPITMIADGPMVVAVNSKLPIKTMKDLLATAKAKPGTVGLSTPGTGSINHLVLEWITLTTGVKFLHVPYKGGSPAITATAGGEVPAGMSALGSALPHIKAGRVRVLAVTTGERNFIDKSWPTLIESGIPGVQSSIWAGLFAPKSVPQPIIDKLYGEIAKILQLPEVKARLAARGDVPGGMRPEQFGASIRKEAASLKKVAVAARIKPE